MEAFGAHITEVRSDKRQITESLIKEMIRVAAEISRRPDHWYCDQLRNHDAISGYLPLGDEIWGQTNGRVTAFVHSVSTAHSIHGVTQALWKHSRDIRVIAVEPDESAVLSGRASGAHKIEGIGIGFVPPLWQPELVSEIQTVTTEDAKTMARRRARAHCRPSVLYVLSEGIYRDYDAAGNVIEEQKVRRLRIELKK